MKQHPVGRTHWLIKQSYRNYAKQYYRRVITSFARSCETISSTCGRRILLIQSSLREVRATRPLSPSRFPRRSGLVRSGRLLLCVGCVRLCDVCVGRRNMSLLRLWSELQMPCRRRIAVHMSVCDSLWVLSECNSPSALPSVPYVYFALALGFARSPWLCQRTNSNDFLVV